MPSISSLAIEGMNGSPMVIPLDNELETLSYFTKCLFTACTLILLRLPLASISKLS